jgi:phage gp16-like protein
MARSSPVQRQIAAIHVLKAKAGMDDDAYRAMLRQMGGVESSKALTALGRTMVLDHLRRITQPPVGEPRSRPYPDRPHTTDQRPLLQKIEAQLAEAGRPWHYATAVLKRVGQGRAERLEFATDEDLRKVVAALNCDAKRHGRRTA